MWQCVERWAWLRKQFFSFILGYRKLNLVVKNRNEETKRDMHGEDCNVKLYNNFKSSNILASDADTLDKALVAKVLLS